MPDTEISKLPELTQVQLQPTDVLPVDDLSAVETKKVTASALVLGVLDQIPDGTIDPDKLDWSILSSGSISGEDITDTTIAGRNIRGNR